jgi:hypothetical protein
MCQSKWTWMGTLSLLGTLLLGAALLSGCRPAKAADRPVATDTVEPAPVVKPSDPAMALDAAMTYLREEYGDAAPAAGIAWQAEDATPGGLVGSNTTRYTAEGWTVTVLTPVVNPVDVVYQVTVDNEALGFHWAGKVDATGHAMTLEAPDAAERTPANLLDAVTARDAALAYIAENDGSTVPAGLAWNEENVTPEDLLGSTTLRYTVEGWTVTVSYPIVAPEYTVYHVQVVNGASGYTWEGEVDATGAVMTAKESGTADRVGSGLGSSLPPSTAALPVTGWLGYVLSTPAGAQFDDYVVLQPEGAGQVGIAGATEALEDQIIAMRDQPEPGKMAHFWGTLSCDVPDYGGCQLLASGLRRGAVATEPEPVEGWFGTLVSNAPGSQFDDYFVLGGTYPVAFGLHSLDPQLQSELEALRDSGTPFRVWGILRTGVPDAFGSQIQVERIEIQ